jgi:hypothetical protein
MVAGRLAADPSVYYNSYTVAMSTNQPAGRSQPFSIRLGEAASLLVGEEALRTGRSRNAVVEELAEEAAKMRLFPGIAFRGMPRRAWVIGTGLDVWELLDLLGSHGGSEARVRESHSLVGERQLQLATTYAQRFPDEIARLVEASQRPLDDLIALYPFLHPGKE